MQLKCLIFLKKTLLHLKSVMHVIFTVFCELEEPSTQAHTQAKEVKCSKR